MQQNVAPHAGAWIEISIDTANLNRSAVAPLMGAWIEIEMVVRQTKMERVAPLVGAWIEIYSEITDKVTAWSRSPRGSVD